MLSVGEEGSNEDHSAKKLMLPSDSITYPKPIPSCTQNYGQTTVFLLSAKYSKCFIKSSAIIRMCLQLHSSWI